MVVGGLIGLMVEEEDDIKNIDYASVDMGGAAAAEATPAATPAPEKAAPVAPKETAQVTSAVGSDAFFDELESMIHGGKYLVAPAAGWWMRTYQILPSEVTATGPKGFILKGDVLAHIEQNKIQKGARVSPVAAPTPAAKPAASKKPAAKKAAAPSKDSPKKDDNNPFQQTWVDHRVEGEEANIAQNIFVQKRYVAHTYISSVCDVSAVQKQVAAIGDDQITLQNFLHKAAAKAFAKTFPEIGAANIARVVPGGLEFTQAANNLQLGGLSGQETHEVSNFGSNSPPAHIIISQVESSMEALPIADASSIISLHFTAPKAEVVPLGTPRLFDIEELDDEHLNYDLNIGVSQTSRVSISYDATKLDEIQAGKFMQLVKFYLDDPDMMLL